MEVAISGFGDLGKRVMLMGRLDILGAAPALASNGEVVTMPEGGSVARQERAFR